MEANADSGNNNNNNANSGGDNGSQNNGGQNTGKTLTLTQAELNAMMAKNRREITTQNQQLLAELEELKSKANMTVEEKADLEQRMEAMRQQFMTADERKTREAEKAQRALQTQLDGIKGEAVKWQKLYATHRIQNDLMQAAVGSEAVNPEQIVMLLNGNAGLEETVGADGKPTGAYATVINFATTDKDNKPITLKLSPVDAVTRMKEDAARYGNLFKATLKSGFGGANSGATGTGQPSQEALKDTATYMKWRADRAKKGIK